MRDLLSNLPTSRAEARKRGFDRFFSGAPCVHGHVAPRYLSTSNCVQCQVEHARRNGGWNARPAKVEYLRIARELIEKKGGALLSTEYVSAKSKLRIQCGEGHEFAATYDNLRHGRWCRTCKRERHSKRMAARFRSVEELCEFARRLHGGDCLATSPVSVLTKVLWKCRFSEHEPFLATPSHVMAHKNPTWCPACDAERRRFHPPKPPIPRDRVEQLVGRKGGEIIAIVGDDVWRGGKTRLKLRCARGHEWTATVDNLVHRHSWCGGGCQSRFGERITRAILEATFSAEFPPARPPWMPPGPSGKHQLTLDGYNERLKLAFEYQGPHHASQQVMEADAKKLLACGTNGVRLLVIKGIKQPFPPQRVLAQVKEAFGIARIQKSPELPAHDIFEHELRQLRQLGEKRGGTCLAKVFKGWDAQYDWKCSRADHPLWWATKHLIGKVGTWCGHCAGNARLDIEELRKWGLTNGLELLDTDYRGTASVYSWQCVKGGHIICRSKGNIQQSLNRGNLACNRCGPGISANSLARKKQADNLAMTLSSIIENLRQAGFTSLEALAHQLNDRRIPTARGARWYASTVKNVLDRVKNLA